MAAVLEGRAASASNSAPGKLLAPACPKLRMRMMFLKVNSFKKLTLNRRLSPPATDGVLFREGDPPTRLYLLKGGEVTLTMH